MTTPLARKFLRGAQRVLARGGFTASIERTMSTGGPNLDDPLGPDLLPETMTVTATVFVASPRREYQNGSLAVIGDGQLFVDLLSIEGNSEDLISFIPRNGDYLIYPSGRRQVLSDTNSPAVNNQVVVTFADVTG